MSSLDAPTMPEDQNNFRYPVFRQEMKLSVACTSTAAPLSAATTKLKYLCCTVGFFYRVGGTASAAAGQNVYFVPAGVSWAVDLEVGDVISFIASDADGIMTHSDMK